MNFLARSIGQHLYSISSEGNLSDSTGDTERVGHGDISTAIKIRREEHRSDLINLMCATEPSTTLGIFSDGQFSKANKVKPQVDCEGKYFSLRPFFWSARGEQTLLDSNTHIRAAFGSRREVAGTPSEIDTSLTTGRPLEYFS
jgi:hypothetical protein